ncbi:MAG: bifunctional 2-keto-4-hydroxyglutarate aldolase/2-keto-3-deoxy-6-phosphogluconate aldolase [Treponema sp.]
MKMKKYEVLKTLVDLGIIAVIRGQSASSLKQTILAIKEGGVKAIEITTTVSNADVLIGELISDADIIVGAGTVLDAITARLCIMRGASFIVSPSFSLEVAKICNLYNVLYVPGVATPREITDAMEAGCSLLKLFPASNFSPSIISDFLGPFPQCSFMPTGGISLENVGEWIRKGASLVGVGGVLTKGAKTGDYASVKATAKLFVEEVEKARK